MKTNRRGFLGLFGAATVAAPSMATVSYQEMMNLPFADFSDQPSQDAVKMGDDTSWAKRSLKKLIGKTAVQRQREKARFSVYQWDINVVSLRSINMHTRVRMSRERAFERSERREYDYLDGVINGFW